MKRSLLISILAFTLLWMVPGGSLPQAQERPGAPPQPEPILTTLWTPPTDLAARDLYYGPGGEAGAPDLRRVTYLKDQEGGHTTKYRVRDASGREWVAKLGNEAQAETAAVRLLWAVGYPTEINYLVPKVNIRGKGTFENVRFEARPKDVKRKGEWKWEQNPFTGSRELQGLKIMMALLENWDLKDTNNVILMSKDTGGSSGEMRYVISDLGATFGKQSTGPFWRITRSRNNPGDYENAKFIDGVKDGRVDFNYTGVNSHLFDNVSMQDAVWISELLSQLSDRQISDAFRAANYSPQDRDRLTRTVRERIDELAAATGRARGITVSN